MNNLTIHEEESLLKRFARLTRLYILNGEQKNDNEESKDLSSLALDELIGNLKVHEVVMEKDSEIYKGKKERIKSIALKAKKESSDDETSTSRSDDEEYVMAVRNFKKFFRRKGKFVRQPREEKKSFRQRDEKKGKSDRKCFRCGDPNHLIGDCPKPILAKPQVSKRLSLEALGAIARMTPKTKPTTKLVSWLNRQMRKIQNQLGSSIIAIRTDHGRKIDNEVQFGAYCDAQGITYNFSAPRTPQSNGVVERKNRTLQEMSRTMLNEQSIPQKFWCNAVDTSTDILNRILIRPILGKPLMKYLEVGNL
ncbi:retrovirus-related pol polyprotein from transposon TNT 1-94 [Tanacetum coccineum]